MTPRHDSIRGWFAAELHSAMLDDDRIWCLTGDLGFSMLDKIRDTFPTRFMNVGASEQLLLGAGIGLALEGKIPFCYSITPFLLFRPMEWVRNYLNHERIPVRLVGSGLEKDYAHDGITHQPSQEELYQYFNMFPNVSSMFPDKKEQIPELVTWMIDNNEPQFLCLRR